MSRAKKNQTGDLAREVNGSKQFYMELVVTYPDVRGIPQVPHCPDTLRER
jgi:hypothetical protein